MLDNTSSKMVLSSIHLDFQPVAPGSIFQVFLRVTIENQVCIRQWIIFRGKQWIRSVFRKKQKIRTLLLSEKVRILLLWCTSRDSNPGPTDQEKPMCNNRQFSESRRTIVFMVLPSIRVLHLLHPLHPSPPRASVIQPFWCAKSVQKCAKPKSAP